MRPLSELIDEDEPGLRLIHEWIAEATNPVTVLDCDSAAGNETLLALQVTTRSPMGAIAHGTGGLLVDKGWIRVLGAGCQELPRSIAIWNEMEAGKANRLPGALLIGDDAVGGFYAISGGGITVPSTQVGYYAPDSLSWENLEMGYSDWLRWLFTGDLAGFYESARWPGWEAEVADLGGDRCIGFYPFLWAAGEPLGKRHRAPVPVRETWNLNVVELPRQLGPRASP